MQSNMITTGEKNKKVFVTGSGNIEVTQVSPMTHPPNVIPNITPNITSNVSNAVQPIYTVIPEIKSFFFVFVLLLVNR